MKTVAAALTTAALFLGSASCEVALADEPAAPAPAPGAPAAEPVKYTGPSIFDVLDGSGIAITGYVDTSYEHLSGNGEFSSFTPDRVFDARHDSFPVRSSGRGTRPVRIC